MPLRSVAIGVALRENDGGDGRDDDLGTETARADALRNAAVDELARRRTEVEWFIEGEFDAYCADMRRPNAWGREPEILMLTHVVKTPIEVFVSEPNDGSGRSVPTAGTSTAATEMTTGDIGVVPRRGALRGAHEVRRVAFSS